MKTQAEGLLAGVYILDLADEQGSLCSKLLADLGATVVKIENPGGDPSRASKSFFYSNLNKLGITLNLKNQAGKQRFKTLIRGADILLESFAPGHLEALDLGYRQLRRINPRLIHLSITAFGQTGPKRNYRSCDCVQAAFGGQMYVSGTSGQRPVKLYGPQSCYTASLFGANAVLLGLRQRRLTKQGSHIDLSIQEAVASTLDHVMIDYFQSTRNTRNQTSDLQADSFFVLPCEDGFVAMPLMRNWETILELVNSARVPAERLGDEWENAQFRRNHIPLFFDAVASWSAQYTKKELFRLGQAMGFPWAPVDSLEEVLRSPQLRARNFFMHTNPAGKRKAVVVPGPPYRFSAFVPSAPRTAPLPGQHTRKVLRLFADRRQDRFAQTSKTMRNPSICPGEILRGIRVLDFTRMLSGPYATRILGDFGAEVIKVQSRLTASGAERNDSPYFCAWNRNKRSIGLNLNHPEAKQILLELVSVSDVVVENFSPRVLANWGLTYPHLKAVKPDLIMASISAMGQTGPWKNFIGFAETFHALSGLMHTTSPSAYPPVPVGFAYGDFIAGLFSALAIFASVEYRDRTGKGQRIDLSAYEALCTLLGADFIQSSSNRKPQSNNAGDAMEWGCYPCTGVDRWCVIAIFSKKEWKRFCDVSKLTNLKLIDFSEWSRKGNARAEIDRQISQWTSTLAAEAVVRRLQRAGIAAGVVQTAEDLARDSHLASRRFFTQPGRPEFAIRFSDRSALWPWDKEPNHWEPAPKLGEANHHVVVDLLGHSNIEFHAMLKKGILQH